MMDRRAFMLVSVSAGAAVPWPTAAFAQTRTKVRTVGLLMTTSRSVASHIAAAVVDGLRELGHTEGKNVLFEYRWAEGQRERLAELGAELVRHPVDVIIASSQAAALAAQRATKTIPIVMVNAVDPVEAGLVTRLAPPRGNRTRLRTDPTPQSLSQPLPPLHEMIRQGAPPPGGAL